MSEFPASIAGLEKDHSVSLADFLKKQMRGLEAHMNGRMDGFATGFSELDEMTGGLHPGDFIVVGALPAMGGNTFLLSLAERMAEGGGIPVGFFSMEVGGGTLAWGFLASRTRLPTKRFREGGLDREERSELQRALESFGGIPLLVDDTPALSMEQLSGRVRVMVKKHRIKVLFVDSLQSIVTLGCLDQDEERRGIVEELKELAQELDIPVVCSAPVRPVDHEDLDEACRVMLKDLQFGNAAQVADVVALIHRAEYFHKGDADWLEAHPEKRGLAEIIVEKNRRGPTGVVEMRWDARGRRFWGMG